MVPALDTLGRALAADLPMAVAIAAFGDYATATALVPLTYTCAGLMLIALNLEHHVGRTAAMLSSASLALTPAINMTALQPNVDGAELAWLAAAALALQCALRRNDGRAALLAGVLLGVAVLTRATALVALPIVALVYRDIVRRRVALLPLVLLGLILPLAAEMIGYIMTAGDPLYGWRLSFHHTRIPSTELPPGVDLTRGALLNLDFIKSWRRSMGVEVHWMVDPLLNLLADPRAGLTQVSAAALSILHHRRIVAAAPWLAPLAIAGVLHFLSLVFVLAIDPKPRMFLVELAIAASVIGVTAAAAWRAQARALPAVLFILLGGRALALAWDTPDVGPATTVAQAWAVADSALAVDDWPRRSLAFSPALMALPSVGPRALRLTTGSCRALARPGGLHVVRVRRLAQPEPAAIAWLRSRAVLFGPRVTPSLCVLSRSA